VKHVHPLDEADVRQRLQVSCAESNGWWSQGEGV